MEPDCEDTRRESRRIEFAKCANLKPKAKDQQGVDRQKLKIPQKRIQYHFSILSVSMSPQDFLF